MKILLYENRKIDPICWDASTPEKERLSLLCLFKYLDESWECYGDLDRADEDLRLALSDLNKLEEMPIPTDHPSYPNSEEQKVFLKKKVVELKHAVNQAFWLKLARKGNMKAVRNLLCARMNNQEYEFWQIIDVLEPLKEVANGR